MISTQVQRGSGTVCMVVRPSVELNWRLTLTVYFMVSVTGLLVAVVFAFMGFWPILPFAGLELTLLGWALYASAIRVSAQEVVTVDDRTVLVERGRRHPEQVWRFERTWTEVAYTPARHRWYPSRVVLRSKGKELALGRFLLNDERAQLAAELGRLIGPMAAR